MRSTWKLSYKQLGVVLCLGVASFLIIDYSFGAMQKRYVRDIVNSRFERVMADIDKSGREAASIASLFANLSEVEKAYKIALSGDINREDSPQAQKAREHLRKSLAPMLDSYAEHDPEGKRLQLHFHLPNIRSLARLWRDKQTQRNGEWVDISDDLSSFRTTVKHVNDTGKVVCGVELGSGGFVIRGIVPVRSATGDQLGSVEVLQDFDKLLEAAAGSAKGDSKDQSELLLYVNENRVHVATALQDREKNPLLGDFVRVTEPKKNIAKAYITPELLAAGRAKKEFYFFRSLAIATKPLPDYKGEQLGVLVYAMETKELSQLGTTARVTLGVTLSVLFIMVLFLNDVSTLIRAKNRAESASHAKSDFLSRMSHEMRTPMNAIIGMTSIGLAATDPERKQHCLQKVEGASRHLLGVINDILDMSKIEAEKFELANTRFNIFHMLQRTIDVIRYPVDVKHQKFKSVIDGGLPAFIMGDEQRIAQVITNLLSNAIKFTPDGGRITLRVDKDHEDEENVGLRISVTDSGIGMAEEQIARLFNPFEQADGTISRQYGGTGLGLSISKHIAEMMGGNIEVNSAPGKGSTFTFLVKVPKASQSQQGAGKDADSHEDPDSTGIFKGKRILLAEDLEINREITEALLEHTGIEIMCAEDGCEALDMFTGDPLGFELILMDVQMPHMDGCEATKRIRASGLPGAETIPIIAITANVFKEDVEQYLAEGMNGHLGKPLDSKELIAMLRRYLLASSGE